MRRPLAVAVARATGAAGAAVSPAAATAAFTRTARTAVAAASSAATARQRGELLDRLAGDLGIVASAHADTTALAVDLDNADGDLVALAEHLLDRVDPVAG
jgi:hypothetical protein